MCDDSPNLYISAPRLTWGGSKNVILVGTGGFLDKVGMQASAEDRTYTVMLMFVAVEQQEPVSRDRRNSAMASGL